MNTMVPNQWKNIQPATNANYGSATVPLFVALQPYPQFGNGNYGTNNGVVAHGYPAGDSEYSSLQAKVQKRLTNHFTALASFTWAKLITDDGNPPLDFVGSHAGLPQDSRNLNLEHSVSPQDVKYQFTAQASYDLPLGKGRALQLHGTSDALLGGWTVNGITYLSTGIPINAPISGVMPSYFNQRADMTCDASKGAPHTLLRSGSAPTAFHCQLARSWRELRRPILTMSAPWAPRMSISHSSKHLRLQKKRTSALNIANKAKFAAPNVAGLFTTLKMEGTFAVRAARLLLTMGQDEAIPRRFFGVVDARNHIPRNNVLLIGAICLAGALAFSYQLGTELLNYGALLAFMGVNLSSAVLGWRAGRLGQWWPILISLSGFAICFFLWLHLGMIARVAGSVWALLGIAAYLFRRTRGQVRI